MHITQCNHTPKEQNPDFPTEVDPASRFNGRIAAAKNLRARCGADLTPEWKTILELPRVRSEITCMRGDTCRVAGYHPLQGGHRTAAN